MRLNQEWSRWIWSRAKKYTLPHLRPMVDAAHSPIGVDQSSRDSAEVLCRCTDRSRRIDRRHLRDQSKKWMTWHSFCDDQDTDSRRHFELVSVAWREKVKIKEQYSSYHGWLPSFTTSWFHQGCHAITIERFSFGKIYNVKDNSLEAVNRWFMFQSLIIRTWSALTFSTVNKNQQRKRGQHVSGRMNRSYSLSLM